MNDDEEVVASENVGFWAEHRFLILIGLSIVMSLILVSISMALYNSSGAAQLDLSRPGYQAVTSQADNNLNNFVSYPSSGKLNGNAINDFRTLYGSQATSAKAVDAFGGDPLSPDALGISAPQ